MSPRVNRYEGRFQPWNSSWLLPGPVGANGPLLFQSAREAASRARWAEEIKGGAINVFDAQNNLFKTIEIAPDASSEDGFVLPSV